MKYLKKVENFEVEEMELKPTAYDMMMDQDKEAWEEELAYEEEEEECGRMAQEEEEEEGYESEVTLEKKKLPAGLKAYLAKKKKKSEDDEGIKGRKPKTEKEKKFAALAPPKNTITYADKIAGATKNMKKKD